MVFVCSGCTCARCYIVSCIGCQQHVEHHMRQIRHVVGSVRQVLVTKPEVDKNKIKYHGTSSAHLSLCMPILTVEPPSCPEKENDAISSSADAPLLGHTCARG